MVGCYKLLGARILCSCNCPGRSGHDVPINLQQTNVILCSADIVSLSEWKRVIPLKVRALRMGYPIYFRL